MSTIEKLFIVRLFHVVFKTNYDILIKDLQLKPYKYQSAHQLLSLDYKRVIFAQWWLDFEKDAHKWMIATDKAYFYQTDKNNQSTTKITECG